jgi:hypothetical protein
MAKIRFSVGRDYLGFNPANPYPRKYDFTPYQPKGLKSAL